MQQLTMFDDVRVGEPVIEGQELVAQERSARVTAALIERKKLSWDDLARLTGLTYSGAYYLMSKIARVVPVTYDREARLWMMVEA